MVRHFHRPRFARATLRATAVVALGVLISACGIKGPLKPQPSASPASTTAPAPQMPPATPPIPDTSLPTRTQ